MINYELDKGNGTEVIIFSSEDDGYVIDEDTLLKMIQLAFDIPSLKLDDLLELFEKLTDRED